MTLAARHRYALAAGVLFLLYAVGLIVRPGGSGFMETYGDLTLTVPPVLATVAAVVIGVRRQGGARWSWLLIGAGCASWAAGQVIWCGYELILHRMMPYPSWADLGYLGCLPLTVTGSALLIGRRAGKLRITLDALLMSGSLLAVSWGFVLGPVYLAGGDTLLERVVSLAYPLGDVAMMTVALLVVAHVGRNARTSVLLVATGAFALSVAHGLYAYQVLHLAYHAGTWVDSGWFGGFLLIGLGALEAPASQRAAEPAKEAPSWNMLPYVPLGAAVVTSVWRTIRDGEPGNFLYCLTLVLVLVVTARQLVSARDNQRLNRRLGGTLDVLREREAELEYQAFHDSLTGLANRALLEDRVQHAQAHQDRSAEAMALIYIDLDGFKKINDELGHHAGDQLLIQVADRLRICARDSDTIARLGGDEFAILCERMHADGDEEVVAARIVEALARTFVLAAGVGQIGASVGIARRSPHGVDAERLMKEADQAMYRAKSSGKGRVSVSPGLAG